MIFYVIIVCSANKVLMDGDQELIDIGSSDEDNEKMDDGEAAVMQEAESLRAAAAMHAQARRNITNELASHQREVCAFI
jgi:hypothetical protein